MPSASDNGPLDLVAMGRVSVDIYPLQSGPLRGVTTYQQYLGGSATNVAIAAARLGSRAAVLTRTGNDTLADFVDQALDGFGVDRRYVTRVDGGQTPVVVAELDPPAEPTFHFYRPNAPDLELHTAALDVDGIMASRVLWTTGTGLSREPSRSTTLELMREFRRRNPDAHCIHDLDWRPSLWRLNERDSASRHARSATDAATVVIGNLAETDMALGTGADHEAAAAALIDRGVRIAVVKLGARGVHARSADGERVTVAPVRVDVVCGAGTGDAFGGAFCHGLLNRWPLEHCVRFANAAGAIVASQLSCSDAMPTVAQVEQLMERSGRASV